MTQHVLAAGGRRAQPVDLVERVEHHAPDARGERRAQLAVRFGVAVQQDPSSRPAGGQGGGELPGRAHVERQASPATSAAISRHWKALPA
nr:hypothetical protein [Saccharopolyspora erythraea]